MNIKVEPFRQEDRREGSTLDAIISVFIPVWTKIEVAK